MRKFLSAICFFFSMVATGQRIQVLVGTTLKYQVEERGRKYDYIVTVDALNDTAFELNWKVSGKPVYKGSSVNNNPDYHYAERLMIKPNLESEENLDESSTRLCLSRWMNEDVESAADTLEYGVDGADAVLAWRPVTKKIRQLLYNGKTANFEYRQYRDAFLDISVGFMPYGARNWWVYYYKDENITMELVEITTPSNESKQELSAQ